MPDDLDPQAFDSLTIGVEEARVVVRRGHPLLGRRPATLADASGYEWVMQPRGAPLRRAVETLFQVADVAPPDRFLTTTSIFMTMTLVASSDALAPLASAAARFVGHDGAPGKLAILPTDFSIVAQPYSLIALRNRALSPAAQAVYDIVREQAFSARAQELRRQHGGALQAPVAQVGEGEIGVLEPVERDFGMDVGAAGGCEEFGGVGAGQIGHRNDLPFLPQRAVGELGMSLMWMPAQTTRPPFRVARSAAGTSAPTGANRIAASSGAGAGSSVPPAHAAPSPRAKLCAATSPGRVKA